MFQDQKSQFHIECLDPIINRDQILKLHRTQCSLVRILSPTHEYHYVSNCKLERRDLQVKDDIRTIEDKIMRTENEDLISLYHESGITSLCVHPDVINHLNDSLGIDRTFLRSSKPEYDVKCVVLYRNTIYYGHVWCFIHPDYDMCGIYGMKSSVVNMLAKGNGDPFRRNVATRIIETGVIPLAVEAGKSRIIVPWPLPTMCHILTKLGWSEYNSTESNSERTFLRPYTGTSNYWISNVIGSVNASEETLPKDSSEDSEDSVISEEEVAALCQKAFACLRCEGDVLRLCFSGDYNAEIRDDHSYTFVRDGNHQNSGFLRISPSEFLILLSSLSSLSSVSSLSE